MSSEILTEQDADFLFVQVIRQSHRADRGDEGLFRPPVGVLFFDGPGGDEEDAFVRTASGVVVRIAPAGRKAAAILARRLRAHLGLATGASDDDLLAEVLRLSCSVIDGTISPKTKNLGRLLLDQTARRLARSVVVLPLTGINLGPAADGSCSPMALSPRLLLGHVNEETEAAISALAKRGVGAAFRFSEGAWWTEDYNGRRRDPESYEEEPLDESVTVLAVVVDAVDMTATLRARQLAEGLLGALWLVDQRDAQWPCMPPTLLGAPTAAENPRSPGLEPDRALPIATLQADTRDRGTKAVPLFVRAPAVNARAAVEAQAELFDLVSQAETPGGRQRLARRVLAACRLAALAEPQGAFDLQILHMVVALEALISDHEASSGVTDRFVRRLLGLLDSAAPTQGQLEALYDARSQVGHQGFSPSPLAHLADTASFALDLVRKAVLSIAVTSATLQLQDDQALLRWLDLAAPISEPPSGTGSGNRATRR
ncbi:hypothetical protein [Geodermatophilus africanus]|nr:hypothetical protein [Geodermatophilus africanus]